MPGPMNATTPGNRPKDDDKTSFTPVNSQHNNNNGTGGTIIVGARPSLPPLAPNPHPTGAGTSSPGTSRQEDWPRRPSGEISHKRKRSPGPEPVYRTPAPPAPQPTQYSPNQNQKAQQSLQHPSQNTPHQQHLQPHPPHHPQQHPPPAYSPQQQQPRSPPLPQPQQSPQQPPAPQQQQQPAPQAQTPQQQRSPQQNQLHNPQHPPQSPAFRTVAPAPEGPRSGVENDRTQRQDNAEERKSERSGTADDDISLNDHGAHHHGAHGQSPPSGTPGAENDKKRKRQFSNRTKTGCLTCRRRKKKCDEAKPECNNCKRGGFNCEGYAGKINWSRPPDKHKGPVNIQSKSEVQMMQPGHHSHTDQAHSPVYGAAFSNYNQDRRQSRDSTSPIARQIHAFTNPVPQPPGQPPGQPVNAPQITYAPIPTQPTQPIQPPPPPPPPPPPVHGVPQTVPPGFTPSVGGPQGKSEKDKMLTSETYYPSVPELEAERLRCRLACYRFNSAIGICASPAEQHRLLMDILRPNGQWEGMPGGMIGENVKVEAPFNCTYGYNISLEDGVEIAGGCTILDSCPVVIKKNAVIDATCHINTQSRPSDPKKRGGQRPQTARKITIGESAWLGVNTTVLPGVTIGDGVVVGAGSVVSKDIPPYTMADGHPAEVIRGIYSNGVNNS